MNSMKTISGRTARWLCLGLALLAAGCGRPSKPVWKLSDVSGLVAPLRFTLTDDTGRVVHAADFRGKVVMMYFGYTHCPDVCPTTLAKLGAALHTLGPAADKVRVLFVSVDPARDTRSVLHTYVRTFGPQFVGLRGGDDELGRLARRYRVAFSRGKPNAKGDYAVTHSSAVFIFDARGKARLLAASADRSAAIAHDLRGLLAAS